MKEAEGGEAQPTSGEAGTSPAGAKLLSPGLKAALLAIGLLLVVSCPLWAPLLMRRMAFFRVRRVEIIGARYVAARDILARLHVDTLASVWDPTAPLANRVASQTGILRADVQRKLPGTLVIEIVERIPVALVPASTGFRVYDERGVALPIDPARVTVDAPVLVERDTALLRLLGTIRAARPTLYARVSEVRRVGKNELILQLKTLPVRAMMNVTLDRLSDIDPVEADLSRKQLRVAELDLRYRDQVIARLQ